MKRMWRDRTCDWSEAVTSDFVDDQVHLPIGALSQLADDLVVFIDVQLLQVLRGDQLELLQDVDGGAGAVGRGVHCCGRDGPEPRRGGLVWRRMFLWKRRSRKERKFQYVTRCPPKSPCEQRTPTDPAPYEHTTWYQQNASLSPGQTNGYTTFDCVVTVWNNDHREREHNQRRGWKTGRQVWSVSTPVCSKQSLKTVWRKTSES